MKKWYEKKFTKIFLGSLGLLLVILGWFMENSENIPLMDKWIFRSYYNAKTGIEKLSVDKVLSPNDRGFQEISEWFEEFLRAANRKEVKEWLFKQPRGEEYFKAFLNPKVTMIKMTKEPMGALINRKGTLGAEIVSKMELTFVMEKLSEPISYEVQEFDRKIEEKYRLKTLVKVSAWIFWIGVLIVFLELLILILEKD